MAPLTPPTPPPSKRSRRMDSRIAAERSAYFARREAAKVLRLVLQGDARRRATASIKSLVYSPSVRNKKATFALVCQTLKCLPLLKDIFAASNIISRKWKKQEELIYVTAYDILFGQKIAFTGDVEKFIVLHKDALEAALSQFCVRQQVENVRDLLQNSLVSVSKPRYARVNTLKVDVDSVIDELGRTYKVSKDNLVPDLILMPSGVDLHDHPLVLNGSMFLQGKASSMVAASLSPNSGWKVLDACAAPGNKTVHLAALMEGKGNIIACELHQERAKILEDTVKRAGAPNVSIINRDFLDIKATDPMFEKVCAILLDPSCSGSGISTERLDHLLPSYKGTHADESNSERVKKLAAFQRKALSHALSFPAVERVVYSTCSIYQTENEDVVKAVLPLATSLNFELATPFPEWPHRGYPVFDGSEHLLRTNPTEDTEGFFIALFVKKPCARSTKSGAESRRREVKMKKADRRKRYPLLKMPMMWLCSQKSRCRTKRR